MQKEKTKDNGTKRQGLDFSFCSPKNFQMMFEKGSQCFAARDTVMDCSSMTAGRMKKMMNMCCLPHSTDFKDKSDSQKDQGI